jgi:hypothetical protein
MPDMMQKYKQEVRPALQAKLGCKNVMQIPKLEKIVISTGMKSGVERDTFAEAQKQIGLITGQQPVTRSPLPEVDTPELTLRRCYGREMRCLSQYEARQSDPQYGHIFRTLAQQEKAHCHRILEILGAITK